MDVGMKAVPNNTYCKGCLSRDRILKIITNDEINQTYCAIIHKKLQTPGPLVLCWECVANIQRYITFRRQVSDAHDVLLKYMVSPAEIRSLSKLTIVRNNIEISINNTLEENEGEKFISTLKQEDSLSGLTRTPEETESNVLYGRSDSYNIYTESLRSDERSDVLAPTDAGHTDIQFFKIEDDVEGCFVDDAFHHHDEIDDKSFAVEIEPGYDKKTKVKSKRKRKKIDENEFNDSDDEPLKKKKKKIGKERKHKKKKDNGSKTDIKPGGKREKPAGIVSNPRVNKKLKQLNVGEGQLEMVVLSWEEVEEERQKALSSVVFTRHEYRCHDCIVGFNHRFKLENHMKKHDPSAGELECSVCRVRCRDAHALCAHRRRHRVRVKVCMCVDGAAARAARRGRARPWRPTTPRATTTRPPPTHTCTVCGHAEPTLGKLRNHIKNHAERQKCELCGKTFRDRTSLRTHLFIHKGEKEYSCPRCDKQFLFKKAMEVHLVTHDAPAHLYCYQCDMNFKNHMSYTQHLKYSLKHIDPAKLKHACGACDKRFSAARRLREHELAVHLRLAPLRCTTDLCRFTCSSRPVLRTHIRMVHRNARAQRNHVCDACGKTYTTKKTLEGHLRSHTGERPFACSLCPSTFGYEAALYNHNKLVHLKAKTCRGSTHQPLALQAPEPALNIP
ncbi:unnamed protein product [Arctia plantaginis]|uniref:C2H2-type domain-containing protein n=1 Tax=Arctia plantaginis TaxID=874455 RepID=A0A8S1BI62_ARCPL|nr:unnamed protein product [Arctia plantaginis]